MSDNSAIEWTDATWNPVTGCTKVGEGCRNCYAEKMVHRFPDNFGGSGHPFKVTTHHDRLNIPLKWRKPRKIFVCSMGDLFHKDVPFEFIQQAFAVMEKASHHTFQILTKRPDRMRKFISGEWEGVTDEAGETGWYEPSKHIWLGVSAWDQESADKMIPPLLATPAAVRFISLEPLLGPVDLGRWIGNFDCHPCGRRFWSSDFTDGDPSLVAVLYTDGDYEGVYDVAPDDGEKIYVCPYCKHPDLGTGDVGYICEADKHPSLDWVIVGGETGSGARPMHPHWPRSIRDQCNDAGVPFFFKQWGEWEEFREDDDGRWLYELLIADYSSSVRYPRVHEFDAEKVMGWVGKRKAGRLLDGVEHNGWPEVTK